MFSKILVALDDSSISQHVFAEAVSLAKTINAKLLLLHVLSPQDEHYPPPIYPAIDHTYSSLHTEAMGAYARQREISEHEGIELLKSFTSEAIAAGIETDSTQQTGDPGETVCQLAKTWGADLIILGRRGHTGLAELLWGSVSNHVLHHAPCSVLTIQGGAIAPDSATAATPKDAATTY